MAFEGKAILLKTLCRSDLLKPSSLPIVIEVQIFDCIAMSPTVEELDEAIAWVIRQDANMLWPEDVRKSFDDLKQRLKDGS